MKTNIVENTCTQLQQNIQFSYIYLHVLKKWSLTHPWVFFHRCLKGKETRMVSKRLKHNYITIKNLLKT